MWVVTLSLYRCLSEAEAVAVAVRWVRDTSRAATPATPAEERLQESQKRTVRSISYLFWFYCLAEMLCFMIQNSGAW